MSQNYANPDSSAMGHQKHLQQKGNNQPYQSIEMGPQNGFNQPQSHTQPSTPGYSALIDEDNQNRHQANPSIPQGLPYQYVPPGAHLSGYPVPHYSNGYSNGQYPPPNGVHYGYPVPQDPNQMPAQNPLAHQQNQAYLIENKIRNDFCCYTCLVWFGLIVTVLNLLSAFTGPGLFGSQFLYFVSHVVYLLGYIFALQARSSFDSRKQYSAFIIFCIMTLFGLINSLIFIPIVIDAGYQSLYNPEFQFGPQPTDEEIAEIGHALGVTMIVLFVILPLLINSLTVYYSRAICKLAKERDQILNSLLSANMAA